MQRGKMNQILQFEQNEMNKNYFTEIIQKNLSTGRDTLQKRNKIVLAKDI